MHKFDTKPISLRIKYKHFNMICGVIKKKKKNCCHSSLLFNCWCLSFDPVVIKRIKLGKKKKIQCNQNLNFRFTCQQLSEREEKKNLRSSLTKCYIRNIIKLIRNQVAVIYSRCLNSISTSSSYSYNILCIFNL